MTWYTMGTDGNIYEMILPYPSLSCFLVAADVFKFHKSFDVLLITTKRFRIRIHIFIMVVCL